MRTIPKRKRTYKIYSGFNDPDLEKRVKHPSEIAEINQQREKAGLDAIMFFK